MASSLPDGSKCGVAESVAAGDPSAVETLYDMLNRTVRPYVHCRLRDGETDDLIHQTLTIAVEQIRAGGLRNPAAVLPYIKRIAKRQLAAVFSLRSRQRKSQVEEEAEESTVRTEGDPEADYLQQEQAEIMKRGLKNLPARDRELLTRFYLHEQSLEDIGTEMGLTPTQVRLAKSRAKAKLVAWARNESA